MMWGYRGALPVVVFLLALCQRAGADASIVTRAMTATTIAEIFVTDDAVRAELEVGGPDIQAFRNLLHDEAYELLGNDPKPLPVRLKRFFREDFVIRANAAAPLPGTVRSLAARPRIQRDEITGDPLPVQPEHAEPEA